MSDDLGSEGRVVAEGKLECSGNYVVEEEEEEDSDEEDGGRRPAGVYRRLIFLKNEGVVQTEVKKRECSFVNARELPGGCGNPGG